MLLRPLEFGNAPFVHGIDHRTRLTVAGIRVMKNLLAAPVIALTFLIGRAYAADSVAAPRIDDAMKKLIASHEIAGAVTIVADKDHNLHESAVGQSNIEKNEPMKPDALFWIASMTKPITATSIMILQEEGKLSVDDPVSKYVPELGELKGADGKPVVVLLKHLLTHTSGMVGEAQNDVVTKARTLADLMPAYAKAGVHFAPGTKWEYCQSGINSLGRVIEVVSGKTLPEFFAERIFKPLGMKDTTFYLTDEQLPRLATSYAKKGDALAAAPISFLHGHAATDRDRYPAANGGLFSTADDYARFARMLLNDGTLEGHTILKPESVREMRTIHTGEIKTGFTAGNGWGWGVCVVREPQGISAMLSPGTFGHGGAYGTQFWIDPVKSRVYLLMVQRSNFANSDDSPARLAFQKAAAEMGS